MHFADLDLKGEYKTRCPWDRSILDKKYLLQARDRFQDISGSYQGCPLDILTHISDRILAEQRYVHF